MKTQTVYFVGPRKAEVREENISDPGPGQAQVHCVANGICMAEVSVFTGAEPSQFPRAVGHEGIGVVTKVGKDVTQVAEGDYVVCGRWTSLCNADARSLIKYRKPLRDPALFITEPVCCIVTAVYEYNITPGDRVIVLGAGFMGLLNVQGLAHCPIDDLIVTDVKATNLELAQAYGATEVVHSGTAEGKARLEALKAEPFDLVVEAAGVAETAQMGGMLTRPGGRLGIFAWHHSPRSMDLGLWHTRGLKVSNASPGIGRDHSVNAMLRAARLLEKGVFDLTRLITHRHPVDRIQEAMELASVRPEGYVKGVLTF